MTQPAIGALSAAQLAPRQPPGLKVVFLTEMWERFSYFGNQALLVLYLVKKLGFKDADALAMYGTYAMLIYITPLFGGWIADKILGLRRAAVVGALVMMLGHFAMAIPSLLYFALGLLIVGSGFFKPSMVSMVGELYEGPNDSRRDGGFTLYYMGINVGALLATIICGTVGEKLGWHYGFASAGVGLAIGLFILIIWQRLLGRAGLRKGQRPIGLSDTPLIAAYVSGSVGLVACTLWAWRPAVGVFRGMPGWVVILMGTLLVGALISAWQRLHGRDSNATPLTSVESRRIRALIIVLACVAFFFICSAQAGGSMSLFADRYTRRVIGGHDFPATWFQMINPLLVLAVAPLFTMAWTRVNRSRAGATDTLKIGIGMIVVGLGFGVMTIAQNRANTFGTVGPQWLISAYVLQTVGEVILTPVALALLSRAAPERFLALAMALFMLAIGAANKIAGNLEQLLAGSGVQPYFLLTSISILLGVMLFLVSPVLTRAFEAVELDAPKLRRSREQMQN